MAMMRLATLLALLHCCDAFTLRVQPHTARALRAAPAVCAAEEEPSERRRKRHQRVIRAERQHRRNHHRAPPVPVAQIAEHRSGNELRQRIDPKQIARNPRRLFQIDLAEIDQPVLCAPNDPDDARLLSEVAGTQIDEVFIGSCMTNIGHFRAAGKLLEKQPAGSLKTRLWLAPPTKMDQHQLTEEGYYGIYGKAGARMEMPGCSLCMGNQARVAPKSTVVSTSTRNFPNRLGDGADVYLASAELAAIAAVEGRLPTVEEYKATMGEFNAMAGEIYRYLNFHEIEDFQKAAATVIPVAQEA